MGNWVIWKLWRRFFIVISMILLELYIKENIKLELNSITNWLQHSSLSANGVKKFWGLILPKNMKISIISFPVLPYKVTERFKCLFLVTRNLNVRERNNILDVTKPIKMSGIILFVKQFLAFIVNHCPIMLTMKITRNLLDKKI